MLKTVQNTAVKWLQIQLLRNPVRVWRRPSAASTGGMLPVNMCGPAAQTSCHWSGKHTPPQAPTAPPFSPTEGNASREDAPFKTMTQGWSGSEKRRGYGRREERGKLLCDRQGFCCNLVHGGHLAYFSGTVGSIKPTMIWFPDHSNKPHCQCKHNRLFIYFSFFHHTARM